MTNQSKRLGLALSGGVARGRAHLGVLQVLEQAGIRIDYVSGVSVGALVGACIAAGLDAQTLIGMSDMFKWRHLIRLVALNPFRQNIERLGLTDFHNLEMTLIRTLGDITFDELKLPLVVGATDLISGAAVVIDQGRVAVAVRASSSVPGVVTPVLWRGRLLCDGFASNNMVVEPLRQRGAEVVLGVNIMPLMQGGPRNFFWAGSKAISNLVLNSGEPCSSADVLVEPEVAEVDYLFPSTEELLRLGREAIIPHVARLKALLA
ncbi:MAG: patatin-like phospholipase family protein [Anaerolineae bacterium]